MVAESFIQAMKQVYEQNTVFAYSLQGGGYLQLKNERHRMAASFTHPPKLLVEHPP
jgi:hypothetical protein